MNSESNNSIQTDSDHDRWVKAVWEVVQGIPRGHVLTYGDVARLAGRRGAARRVGQALRRAPRGLKLPWHRVVNAQGKISFPADSVNYARQRALLQEEGVVFENGQIDLARFGYRGALDQLIWGNPL
ncbi:MAG: methylated-DNA--[protein]-cysteine S-methyltransferase [Xanthomonadales bacterium]|nr:methylated-DNA--[protein]-cysteine S-methyltransferase [Xanthomonadales bacterium]